MDIFCIFDNDGKNSIFTKHTYFEILICGHVKVRRSTFTLCKVGMANDRWRQ